VAGNIHFTTAPNSLALHTGDNPEIVKINRKTLAREIGIVNIQFMHQTHSDHVAIVESYSDVDLEADALVTSVAGVAVAVLAADCIPLLLSSDECVAAVHVGRRGVVNGIVDKALDAMESLGAREISATIGPSICGICYQVSPQMYQEVIRDFPKCATSDEKHCLDLPAGVKAMLQSRNVSMNLVGACTLEDSRYFSYRRDATSGRQAGVIWL
jgi:YfiH family protein